MLFWKKTILRENCWLTFNPVSLIQDRCIDNGKNRWGLLIIWSQVFFLNKPQIKEP